MIGKTNAGSSKSLALIRVLYPAGNVVTCSNGVINYRSDASGDYLFGLPQTGNWTITGVDGQGVTKTITFTIARGDGKLVTLDTLIPPEYRATYQEVEYLKLKPNSVANIPFPFANGPGTWDIDFDKVVFEPFLANQNFLSGFTSSVGTDYRSVLGVKNDGTMYLSSQTVTPYNEHSLSFHVSNEQSTRGGSLKVDNEAVATIPSPYLTRENEMCFGYVLSVGSGMGVQFGTFRIKNAGNIVAQFAPCKQRSDGLPGIFNLRDNTFHQGKHQNSTAAADVLTVITCGPGIGT